MLSILSILLLAGDCGLALLMLLLGLLHRGSVEGPLLTLFNVMPFPLPPLPPAFLPSPYPYPDGNLILYADVMLLHRHSCSIIFYVFDRLYV